MSCIRIPARPLAAALALALLAGCATSPGPRAVDERPREEVVAERAQSRWDLLVAGRFIEAYAFLTPGARQLRSAERYEAELAGRPVKWTGAKVLETSCEAEFPACEVRVEVGFKVRSSLTGVGWLESRSILEERWIGLDGEWFHAPVELTEG